MASLLALACTAMTQVDPDSERILEIRLSDRTILSSGMLAYQAANHWYLPLAGLCDALGIAIQLRPALSGAEGYVLTENRKFELRTDTCVARIGGTDRPPDCSRIIPMPEAEDIYVDAGLLSDWLPIGISIDGFKSLATISPREPLPLQQKRQREKDAERIRPGDSGARFPLEIPPTEKLSGPMLDLQLSQSTDIAAGNRRSALSYQGALGAEALGFSSYSFLSGTVGDARTARQTFSRRDPDAHLGGVLGLRQIELFDFLAPPVPLVTAGRFERGLLVSSYPFDYGTFTTQDVEGDLPPGWEVELYQNDILAGRQSGDAPGRFVFREIPLYYGQNVFRLVFYGPYGQRREEYRSYDITPDVSRPGEHYYRSALFMGPESTPLGILQADRSISSHLSLGAALSRLDLTDLNTNETYANLTLNGFAGGTAISATASATGDRASAFEAGARAPLRSVNLGAKVAKLYGGYRSDLFAPRPGPAVSSQADLESSFVIPVSPAIGSTIAARYRSFEGLDRPEGTLRNRLSTQTGPLTWNHELDYTPVNESPVAGMLEAAAFVGGARYRAGLGYTGVKLAAVELEAQGRLTDALSGSVLGRQDLTAHVADVRASLARVWPALAVSADASVSSIREYTLGVTLRASLARDPRADGPVSIATSATPIADQGAVSVIVFVDSNRNGVADPGERRLPGMHVLVNQRDTGAVTDEQGRAVILHLRPDQPVTISISLESLTDPNLRFAREGVRIRPRAGLVADLAYPIVVTGGVAGAIEINGAAGPRAARRVPIELLDADGKVTRRERSDAEGTYWIEDLAPAAYRIRIAPRWLEENHLTARPADRAVVIPAEGGEQQINFLLPKP